MDPGFRCCFRFVFVLFVCFVSVPTCVSSFPRFAGVVVPIYLGELAPPTLRGTLGTLTQFAMVIGILASNLMAFPFATLTGWRYLFAMTPALAAVELLCMPLIFESPRCAGVRRVSKTNEGRGRGGGKDGRWGFIAMDGVLPTGSRRKSPKDSLRSR